MLITEAGAKRAETLLFNNRLISTEPIAMPIEKIGDEQTRDLLVGAKHVLHQRREDDDQHRAYGPEEADRENREEQPRNVHGCADQVHGGADEVPVERDALGRRRGRRHLPARQKTKGGKSNACSGGDCRLARERSGEDGSEKDGNIGSGFHQAGPAKHFILLQMLGQNCIFDRPEEGRVGAHREYRGKHQRDVGEQDAGAADNHDADLRELDDPDEPRLVVIVG